MNDAERLKGHAETYLKSRISQVCAVGPGSLDSSAPFAELGIDSFRALKIVKQLEEDFGALPKTLLFENFNISDLSNYLASKYGQLCAKLAVGGPDPGVPAVKPAAPRSDATRVRREEPVRRRDSRPLLRTEREALTDPGLGTLVREIFARHKNEAGASRGARKIAPHLFIGRERRGYFNYARCKDIVLAYAYTGPDDYFPTLAHEMLDHCKSQGLQLNVFTDRVIEAVGTTPFSATPFGVLQRIVGLQSFSIEGGAMRRLRYQVARFTKAGACRTQEYRCGTDPRVDKGIAGVIDEWCAGKTMVNPLIRDVKEEILAGTLDARHRLFLTYLDEVLQSAILISPLCPDYRGYLMDLEFYRRDMPLGGLEFAIVGMIALLAEEGCDMLSLGGTYGCRIESCANADPGIEKVLDGLHRQNIFNDDGNLQFKNKFRPENRTVYLCRPANDGRPDNVLDIIMMIADPAAVQTTQEDVSRVPSAVKSTVARPRSPEQESRAAILAEFGFNPLNIPAERVTFDLRTDSWAQLKMPAVDAQTKYLRAQLQRGVQVDDSFRAIFPFAYFVVTTSGRAAEEILYQAWPRKGQAIQNLLFPTALFHQIDKGFTPVELPRAEGLAPDSTEVFKGELSLNALQERLAGAPEVIALACMEVGNNAVGGLPVSIQHLKNLKALLSQYSIPLVIDATRIVENARFSVECEPGLSGRDVWGVVRETLEQADTVVCSLAKDFCVSRGGLIATNDRALFQKCSELAAGSRSGLDAINRKVVGLALAERRRIETQVLRRMESVRLIWEALKERGIPVVGPVGGHCVLIDVKRVPEFNDLEHPVASFLAWMYLHTGIAAAAHNVGMQRDTAINGLIRLAVPIGLKSEQVEEIIRRVIELFDLKADIPRLVKEGRAGATFGDVHVSYSLLEEPNNARPAGGNGATRPAEAVESVPQAPLNGTDPAVSAAENDPPAQTQVAAMSEPACQRGSYRVRDVAIIGMAGRYPGARNLDELWKILAQGTDCIREIPQERYERGQHAGGPRYRGGFIDHIDRFDSLFFNISPREAELLDPQERLFLEVAWEAVEDAGYYPEALCPQDGPRNIGVFVGAVWAMYQMQGVNERHASDAASPNSFLWSIANRVSYYMNLCGPSLTVDTACSSSLTALYLACEAIYRGECSAAIVGGVNLDLHRRKFEINRSSGALSKEGVCRSFGKGGDGYVGGEGIGALLIKPLEDALRDGDNIHGVIKSVAVNHGGRSSGYTVPNPRAQADLITAALEGGGVDARSIGYIEAHGTGTELGDPLEFTGLTSVFEKCSLERQACAIGSVKTNIGHLEAAAGVVGVCKVLLQMRHKMLVPSLHSKELNPFIDFQNSPFYVVQQLEPWRPTEAGGVRLPLRAGVSSFGAGGSNAHVILESLELAGETVPNGPEYAFPLSARNEEQLRQVAVRLKEYLSQQAQEDTVAARYTLQNISHTLRVGRKSFECRAVLLARTLAELLEKLTLLIEAGKDHSVLVGSAKNGEVIARLLSRYEQEELAVLLGRGKDVRKLAQSWVEGLLVDWRATSEDGTRQKVSLPTYPFADRRHWFCGDEQLAGGARSMRGMHPLIDTNESTFDRQVFKKTFHAGDFFMAEHRVAGVPTLPGVAYLEFARKAAEAAAGRKVRRIRNVLWLSPIAVRNGVPQEVAIELKPNGEAVHFEVFSEGEGGTKVLHSQGQVYYATREETQAQPQYIDLGGIRARCAKAIDGQAAYPLFESLGLTLGPSFQVLGEVFRGDSETLGALKLPAPRRGDLQSLALHPSLVDGSLQAGAAARLGNSSGEMVVPYSIGEVEILHPLQGDCWSYVTVPDEGKQGSSRVSKANVLIVDTEGKILVRIRETTGVPLREIHKPAAPAGAVSNAATLYYSYEWRKAPLHTGAANPESHGCVVFFDTDSALHDLHEERRRQRGAASERSVLVQAGESFQETGERSYRLNPQNPEDFARLCESLRKKNIRLQRACFASSAAEPRCAPGEQPTRALDHGVHALLYLCQAIAKYPQEDKVRLLYVFRGKEAEFQPHHEAINGFAKALQIEMPKISCKTLELRRADTVLSEVLEAILAELEPVTFDPAAVRYEGSERHVRKLEELDLTSAPTPTGAAGVGLKQGGVYLITGGAGGLGLLFAEYLAREFNARLVLTGRSELDAQRQAKLVELRKTGAEVLYVRADVADRDQIVHAVEECRRRFGRINGVIHAAGVLRDSFIRNKTSREMRAVFAPKIHGTLYLDEATRTDELDFLALFSSLSAIGGNAGQCDYGFANHFMDSFAFQREALRAQGMRAGKTLSFNWSLWAQGGMRLDEQAERIFRKATGIEPLSTAIGLDAFVRGLSSERTQVAVVTGDRGMLETAWGLRKSETRVTVPESRAATPAADGDLTALVQRDLSQIATDFLKLDAGDISPDVILLELGFDSIGLATYANTINDRYKLDLTPILFFEYPSIGEIAKHLASEKRGQILQAHQGSAASDGSAGSPVAADAVDPGRGYGSAIRIQKGWNPGTVDREAAGIPATTGESAGMRFKNQPIAIVGMSGVMPQSEDLEEFWASLRDAKDLVTLVPEDRWRWQDCFGDPLKEANKTHSKWGAFMKEVDKFDPHFFGISPREAHMMDPQQRIFLQTVWSAIEDSGHKVSDLAGTKTGLFVGVATSDYTSLVNRLQIDLDAFTASGTSHSVLANRISFLLNLRGPSSPIDTACSSSLVALHRAIESIHTGSCEMAIVGGVQVMLTPAAHVAFSKAGRLSQDGKCRAFDKQGTGYVRGEGAGAIFLKPLSKAEADGDHIYAVVRGTAENHGGRVTTLTAPNAAAQTELLLDAYEKAGVDPASVGYIECHGTGSSLGDSIEVQALSRAFAQLYKRYGRPAPTRPHCGLSSLKTNIGHLETAAGIAGILKILLSLRHKQIPATLHLTELNPYIDLKGTPFYIVDKTTPWESPSNENGTMLPRRAGISSFGFGGANAHIVLEEYVPSGPRAALMASEQHLIVLSAKSEDRLKAYAQSLADHLERHEVDMASLAYTLQVGRDAFAERLAFVATDQREVRRKLLAFAAAPASRNEARRPTVVGKPANGSGHADSTQESIATLLAEGELGKLAELWMAGAQVDWRQSYPTGFPARLALPTYPFEKSRYWLVSPTNTTMSETVKQHPVLVDEPRIHPVIQFNSSSLKEARIAVNGGGELHE